LDHSSLSSDRQDDKGAPSLSRSAPAKEPFVAGLFCGRSCIATSETDAFILIHVRRASSPRAASNTTYLSQQRRDDSGADVGIVVRKHRGNASTRENFPTAKLRRADINYQKLAAAKAARLTSI
jgi:hypothetical protein